MTGAVFTGLNGQTLFLVACDLSGGDGKDSTNLLRERIDYWRGREQNCCLMSKQWLSMVTEKPGKSKRERIR